MKAVKSSNRRNHIDREGIVAQLLDRCNSLINNILDDPTLGSMPAASLAIFEKFRTTIRESGWSGIPVAEILGDGSAWIWNLADRFFPGVPQTFDTWHLKEHRYEFANLHYKDPGRAKAWVDMKVEALREGRVGTCSAGSRR